MCIKYTSWHSSNYDVTWINGIKQGLCFSSLLSLSVFFFPLVLEELEERKMENQILSPRSPPPYFINPPFLFFHLLSHIFLNWIALKVVSVSIFMASQVALVVKNSRAIAGDIRDVDSILGSGRFPEGGHGNPLQYSCLENPMDSGTWRAAIRSVCKESDVAEAI